MHCATVFTNGDVSITWDESGSSAPDFRSWHVYYAPAASGPFTLIDSLLLYTDTTTVHLAANAANVPAFYYVAFKSNNGTPDILSDTIRAIGLIINNPGNGYARLSWNPTHAPLISTNYPFYYIYREYPAGTIVLIDSVDARTAPIPMTFTDSLSVCDDTVGYYIEARDSLGCSSLSAEKKDRFKDLQAPDIPILDSVSVDASGNATVSWFVRVVRLSAT